MKKLNPRLVVNLSKDWNLVKLCVYDEFAANNLVLHKFQLEITL